MGPAQSPGPGARSLMGGVSDWFELAARGTTPGRELQAGVTTFAAMAYILAVNPGVLADAGMPRPALVTVTALSAALATSIMALLANYPLAMAPGMGINAFFTYTICVGAGIPWQQALGMVFVNGVVFLLLSLSGVRERIVGALPASLTLAITGGIGLFIAFIGLRNGGLVVDSPATLVTHGDFTAGSAVLCLFGLATTAILVARRVPGAIVLGIVIATVVGLLVPDGRGGPVCSTPTATCRAWGACWWPTHWRRSSARCWGRPPWSATWSPRRVSRRGDAPASQD